MSRDRIVVWIPNLRRYARALTGDRDTADDLVQDTLERAINKFHLWRPGDLRTWLFTIMHHVYVNQVRARPPQVPLDDAMLAGEGHALHEAGATTMIDLRSALARLSDEHREALLLVTLEDLSYKDVARALDIPVGTVMSRVARAREKLAELLHGTPASAAPRPRSASLKVIK